MSQSSTESIARCFFEKWQTKTGSVEEWSSPKVFGLLIGLLVVAAFPSVICGRQSFVFRDYGVLAYPTIFYAKQSFWMGEVPLWNPYTDCGVPFLAQWGAMALYPLSLIYLLLPLPWSLGLFCLGHLFLGAMGMYYLGHRWTGNRAGAWVAGTTFIFNGLVFASLEWPNYQVALGWMPWVVLTVEQGWRKGGKRVAIAALVSTMQMLSGVPEIILLTWLFLGVWWLTDWGPDSPGALRKFLRVGMMISLVAALSAAQLLPFFGLLAESQRDTSFGTSAWSMPGWGWANLLVPLFHCARSPQGIYYQPHYIFLTSYYLGIGTVALALLAAWSKRRKQIWLLASCTIFSLLMALGDDGYFHPWLKSIFPALGYARFPIKFIYLAGFTLPLLAGYGIAGLHDELPEAEKKWRWRILHVGGGLFLMVGVVVWFAWRYPLSGDQWPATGLNAAVRVLFLAAILALAYLSFRSGRFPYKKLLLPGLVIILWFEALTGRPDLQPVIDSGAFGPGFAQIHPRPELGQSRAFIRPSAEDRMARNRVADLQDDFIGKRMGLFANLNLLEGIPKVDGAMTLTSREQAQVRELIFHAPDDGLEGLKDFLGVSQITASGKVFDWAPRSGSMPWVTMGQEPVFVDATNSLRMLARTDFAPRKRVYLPLEARAIVKSIPCLEAKVLKQSFYKHRIELEVETPKPTMLVVAQAWHRPWKACIDGKLTRLWKANHAYQAIEVPAGHHLVSLVYKDAMFQSGLAISGLVFILCLGWLALPLKRKAGGTGPNALAQNDTSCLPLRQKGGGECLTAVSIKNSSGLAGRENEPKYG